MGQAWKWPCQWLPPTCPWPDRHVAPHRDQKIESPQESGAGLGGQSQSLPPGTPQPTEFPALEMRLLSPALPTVAKHWVDAVAVTPTVAPTSHPSPDRSAHLPQAPLG